MRGKQPQQNSIVVVVINGWQCNRAINETGYRTRGRMAVMGDGSQSIHSICVAVV
jgi:hypothetical protein